MNETPHDVIVAGAGNAALCAALAARETCGRVLVLERAPAPKRGGNSFFTAGLVRFPFEGIGDLRALIPSMTDAQIEGIDVGAYPESAFRADLDRVTEGEADPGLLDVLVTRAYPTMRWLGRRGLGFALVTGHGRQAFRANGKLRFWGGAPVEYEGKGDGAIARLFDLARDAGIEVLYDARARELIQDEGGRVTGLRAEVGGELCELPARAVVLACGGFEANPAMRAENLGEAWREVNVRGTEFNTGDGIRMALAAGAQRHGDWAGCHAVACDARAPATGDREITNKTMRHSYPFGIVVNRLGRRFIDEGADFRNYTYAKYGKELLNQPGRVAWQIFDAASAALLRDEYAAPGTTRHEAATLEALAAATGIDAPPLLATVAEFNAAIQPGEFDPATLDGKAATGIDPPKSNWAQPIGAPPFIAFPVSCGITFTFGGLRVDPSARVLDAGGRPIPGLFAAGELVGGIFHHNYPGGAGLTAGAVFGRIAGAAAALESAKVTSP